MLRSRKAAESSRFLRHLIRDFMGELQALDFLVSDPIQCDLNCWHASMSASLHALMGALPHLPLIWASWLMGCADTEPYGEPGVGPSGWCVGASPLQIAIFCLVACQSLAFASHCTAWYWNAPFQVKRPLRIVSQVIWRAEAVLSFAYVLNVLLWLILAILVRPLRAAFPVVSLIAVGVYVHQVGKFIGTIHKSLGEPEGAQLLARFLLVSGISASHIIAMVLWGLVLLLFVILWVFLGLSLVQFFSDGQIGVQSVVGSAMSAVGIFAYAIKEGRARAQGSPIASALRMVGMSEAQSGALSGQLTQIGSAVKTVDEAAESTLQAATSAVEGAHQSQVAAVSNV